MAKKFFTPINLNGNQIHNFTIGHQSTSEIETNLIQDGQIAYDHELNQYVIRISGTNKKIAIGNSFTSIGVQSASQGNGSVSPSTAEDHFTFKEGDNVQFSYNEIEKSLTISTNVDYSAENFSEIFGNGDDLTYTITHNLNTLDVIVTVIVEAEASVHPDLSLVRTKIIDENNVSLIFNSAPGVDAVRAVISSKHGQQGVQGPQGGVGVQGIAGPQGPNPSLSNIVFDEADTNKVLKVQGSQMIPSDDIILEENLTTIAKNSKITGNLEIDLPNNGEFGHKIRYNSSGAQGSRDVFEILDKVNEGPQSSIFKILSDGVVFNKNIQDELDPIPEEYPLDTEFLMVGNTNGEMKVSHIGASGIITYKEAAGTISSSQILNSFDIPVKIIENGVGGSILDIKEIYLFYSLGGSPYVWSNPAVFYFPGTNKNLATINTNLINGTKHGYQKIYPAFSDNSLDSFVITNADLYFRTLTANPTGGNGTLKYKITYRHIKF